MFENYIIKEVNLYDFKDWFLYKHYAKRVPPIIYLYGLYNSSLKEIEGLCSFGPPCRMMNGGGSIFDNSLNITTYELNRLIMKENHEKNLLSFFVSKCLDMLPKPNCCVSYADSNMHHCGYIYQATNWIYTGLTQKRKKFVDKNGKDIHERTIYSRYGTTKLEEIDNKDIILTEQEGKHRYIYFNGSSREKKRMKKLLKYTTLPYPKDINKKYDASHVVNNKNSIFDLI